MCTNFVSKNWFIYFYYKFHWFFIIKSYQQVRILDWIRLHFKDLGLFCLVSLYWFCQVHFLLGLTDQFLGLLKKFGLWSFRVMKQLFLPSINILFNEVLFSIILLPSALILLFTLSGTFNVNGTASVVDFSYL